MTAGIFPVGTEGPSTAAVLYLLYARLLDFPTPALIDAVRTGVVENEIGTLHRALGMPPLSPAAVAADCLEEDYIATFELGVPECPIPLYETAYRSDEADDRKSVLEDLIRFYEFFDLDMGARPSELPDHLTTELEFVSALSQGEHAAAARKIDPHSFQLAQRDFIDRHLRPFVSALCSRAAASTTFYGRLLAGLNSLVNREYERLVPMCETRQTESRGA